MILLDHVTKLYPTDPRPALDEVSLHIDPGEFAFMVGKSGAGKSTVIKMITKEENPTSGNITVGGIDLKYVKKRYIPHYRRRLGVVFQDFKLLPDRTVFENVAFALEIAGFSSKEIKNTVPKVLEIVELSDKAKKFPSALSGGEIQRVAIARAVARQPKILIADEPTANLDVLTKSEIINLLQRINDSGTTVLVTTHDENVVNNLRKRVITIKDGRIVADQKDGGVYRLDRASAEAKAKAETLEKLRAVGAVQDRAERIIHTAEEQNLASPKPSLFASDRPAPKRRVRRTKTVAETPLYSIRPTKSKKVAPIVTTSKDPFAAPTVSRKAPRTSSSPAAKPAKVLKPKGGVI
ncbi:cell division ATP-binding protein FtsE [Candidatus Saccharibacteria bacterium]|nr:cell division ATP-binding protein FtsE [Candidatus Saccharibacteria bacterium]